MKFKQKKSKAKELLWLAVAAMCLATGVHKTIFHSFQESWYFFILVLVALLMYLLWRNRRVENQ